VESPLTLILRSLRRGLFGIDPAEVTFERRGFARSHPERVARLEQVALHFVHGYHAALEEPSAERLAGPLEDLPLELRGFAYEGAGMALALLDAVTPGRGGRLQRFLSGPGDRHRYMVQIGAGWAWARLGALRGAVARRLRGLDPVDGWLALDGYGFHEGYFHPDRTVRDGRRPRGVEGAAGRAFDAGVGRSLWFVTGADPDAVAAAVGALAPGRHADLWAGAALAASYAGGVAHAELDALAGHAAPHRGAAAQGAAFAAKARERAGNPAPHTERAVQRLCGVSAGEAAAACDAALAAVERPSGPDGGRAFEAWRGAIRGRFAGAGTPEAFPERERARRLAS